MAGRKTIERKTYAGKLLTEKRLQKGLSQQNIANMIGAALRVYQRLETGESEFCDTRMRFGLALCAILDLDPFMLAFGHEFTHNTVFDLQDLSHSLAGDAEG